MPLRSTVGTAASGASVTATVVSRTEPREQADPAPAPRRAQSSSRLCVLFLWVAGNEEPPRLTGEARVAGESTREEHAPAGPRSHSNRRAVPPTCRAHPAPGPGPRSFLCLERLCLLLRASLNTAPRSVVFDTWNDLRSSGLLWFPPREAGRCTSRPCSFYDCGGLIVRAEVNLLKRNHKWFTCAPSLFLSISGPGHQDSPWCPPHQAPGRQEDPATVPPPHPIGQNVIRSRGCSQLQGRLGNPVFTALCTHTLRDGKEDLGRTQQPVSVR